MISKGPHPEADVTCLSAIDGTKAVAGAATRAARAAAIDVVFMMLT